MATAKSKKTTAKSAPKKKRNTKTTASKRAKKPAILMPDKKAVFGFSIAGLLLAAAVILIVEFSSRGETLRPEDCDFCKNAAAQIVSSRQLSDKESLHIQHARAGGLKTPLTRQEFVSKKDSLFSNDILVKLSSDRYFTLAEMRDGSMPYVAPEVKDFLDELGRAFQSNLISGGLPKYKLNIVSAFTLADERSAFQSDKYGSSIGVSYGSYLHRGKSVDDSAASDILRSTLSDMRLRCRCIVTDIPSEKYYRITVVTTK